MVGAGWEGAAGVWAEGEGGEVAAGGLLGVRGSSEVCYTEVWGAREEDLGAASSYTQGPSPGPQRLHVSQGTQGTRSSRQPSDSLSTSSRPLSGRHVTYSVQVAPCQCLVRIPVSMKKAGTRSGKEGTDSTLRPRDGPRRNKNSAVQDGTWNRVGAAMRTPLLASKVTACTHDSNRSWQCTPPGMPRHSPWNALYSFWNALYSLECTDLTLECTVLTLECESPLEQLVCGQRCTAPGPRQEAHGKG